MISACESRGNFLANIAHTLKDGEKILIIKTAYLIKRFYLQA